MKSKSEIKYFLHSKFRSNESNEILTGAMRSIIYNNMDTSTYLNFLRTELLLLNNKELYLGIRMSLRTLPLPDYYEY